MTAMTDYFQSTAYGWLMLTGICVGIVFWTRLAKKDSRLLVIYITALCGAFLGAKLIFLLAEGWHYWNAPDRWRQLVTGKSILGALLGGYAAVELAKKMIGYQRATGDWFAFIAPIGIIVGRIGCMLHGCCLGVRCDAAWYSVADKGGNPRWPAVPLEIGFNLAAILAFLIFRKRGKFPGQHFHIYLIGYGIFRFAHEFLRATPKLWGMLSGYQIAAVLVFLLGLVGFLRRRNPRLRYAMT